jgi:hypothetical protein
VLIHRLVLSVTSLFDLGVQVADVGLRLGDKFACLLLLLLWLLQVIFLPVCPWRTDPESGAGWKKAVAGHVSQ